MVKTAIAPWKHALIIRNHKSGKKAGHTAGVLGLSSFVVASIIRKWKVNHAGAALIRSKPHKAVHIRAGGKTPHSQDQNRISFIKVQGIRCFDNVNGFINGFAAASSVPGPTLAKGVAGLLLSQTGGTPLGIEH